MVLYLKTNLEKELKRLVVYKVEIQHENSNFINLKQFPHFSKINEYGILNVKIHPHEAKKWFDELPAKIKDEDYILAWDGGWLSIPGEIIEEIIIDQA